MKQIIPHLAVKNVQQSTDFYTNVLGFDLYFVQRNKNGIAGFAILRKSKIEIMIADTSSMPQKLFGFDRISASVVIYIEMDDVDGYYEIIKDKVNIKRQLEDTSWGTREFWITDSDNYNFSFFKNL
jgi:uncharacterized glyoxalase superfamily protein PhnB